MIHTERWFLSGERRFLHVREGSKTNTAVDTRAIGYDIVERISSAEGSGF